MVQNLRYAIRMLSKNPGFTAAAVLALGLGIGANSAIYSLADVLIYRPLLIPDIDRAVIVVGSAKTNRKAFDQVSPADFIDFERDVRSIEQLAAATQTSLNITGDGEPERVSGARVSAGFFTGLGAQPALGRMFLASEDSPGANLEAILSHSLWRNHYASDPNILARGIRLEGQTYRIVGVMSKDFSYPPDTDLWIPMAMDARERNMRTAGILTVIGRLKPGSSLTAARAEVEALGERIAERFPESHRNRAYRVELLREYVSGNLVADFVRMLLASVAFVLLIACSNVANLQLARVSMRSKEIAVRAALGAGRFRIVRQFLTESVLLGLLGAGLGVVLAYWGLALMRPALPASVVRQLPSWNRLGVDSHVLLFTLTIATLASLIAGIVPAWFGSRADLNETLKESGRGTSTSARRHRLRGALVVGQIVLALVLLVGAGLLAKGSRLVSDPAPNLDPATALTMRMTLADSKYARPVDVAAFEQKFVPALRALPGVTAATLVSNIPYSGSWGNVNFTIEGRDPRAAGPSATAVNQRISPDYFRAFHLPLREGRGFTEADGRDAPNVAIISRAFANRFFAGQSPLGRRVKVGLASEGSDWMTIVGVASDVRQIPFDKTYRPVLYRPFQQWPARGFDVLIRTSGDPKQLEAAARARLTAIDPDQPIFQLKTLDQLFDDQLSGFRFLSVLMGIFGLVALFLSGIGVYAMMAYSVNERTHEIGVRMALGARAADVLWLVVRRGLVLTAIGLAIGLPATIALARLIANLLFGVNEYDPAVFATGLVVLTGAAALASYIPARRATRVDPIITLRTE